MLIQQGGFAGVAPPLVEDTRNAITTGGSLVLYVSKNGGAYAVAAGTATISGLGFTTGHYVQISPATGDLDTLGQLAFAIDDGVGGSWFSQGDYQVVAWNAQAGAVAQVTGDVAGHVGSVLGNVGGTVASVVGNVGGNVTGDVGGNVVGSVASVVGNVGGNVVGTVASVAGDVGGNVVGNVGGTVTGGVALTPAGLDAVVIETGFNGRQTLALIAAAVAGVDLGGSSTDYAYQSIDNSAPRIAATVTAGKRATVTLTPPP